MTLRRCSMTFFVCFYILLGFIIFGVFHLKFNECIAYFLVGNYIVVFWVACLYLEKRSFTSGSKNSLGLLDPYFVTGLTEAEGSFSKTKHKETKAKFGMSIGTLFNYFKLKLYYYTTLLIPYYQIVLLICSIVNFIVCNSIYFLIILYSDACLNDTLNFLCVYSEAFYLDNYNNFYSETYHLDNYNNFYSEAFHLDTYNTVYSEAFHLDTNNTVYSSGGNYDPVREAAAYNLAESQNDQNNGGGGPSGDGPSGNGYSGNTPRYDTDNLADYLELRPHNKLCSTIKVCSTGIRFKEVEHLSPQNRYYSHVAACVRKENPGVFYSNAGQTPITPELCRTIRNLRRNY